MDKSPVDLLHLPGTPLGAETGCGLGCSGKDDHTGYRPVDSVNESEKDVSRFLVPPLDVLLDQFHKMGGPGFVSLNQNSGRFVHADEVVVFVEDKKVLGSQFAWEILNHAGSVSFRGEGDAGI